MAARQNTAAVPAGGPAAKPEKVKITFPKIRGDKDQTIFVGVNDENYLIQRGKEVEVPAYVVEVIRNSEAAMDEADAFNAKVATDN